MQRIIINLSEVQPRSVAFKVFGALLPSFVRKHPPYLSSLNFSDPPHHLIDRTTRRFKENAGSATVYLSSTLKHPVLV